VFNYLSVAVEGVYQLVLSLTFPMPPLKPQTKDLEEILQSIQERLSCIQVQMEDNHNRQAAMKTNNDSVQSTLTFLMNQIPSTHPDENTSHPPGSTQYNSNPLPNIRSPKLQLAFFEGPEPLDWLFQAEQYFTFYHIPSELRISMVAFHMKGEALSWFKWLHPKNLITDWTSFTRALELRFGPSTYPNHQAELFKLQQTTTVPDYQSRFEKLCNCVVGLNPDIILNCFISGLQPEIHRELSILNPYFVSQAIGLAKLIEDKHRDSKPRPQHFLTP